MKTASVTILNGTTEANVDYAIPADGTRDFNLMLDQEEANASLTVSCTAAPQGSITITRDYGDDTGTFNYSGDLGAFSIAVNGAPASQLFPSLSPGVYSVSEMLTGADGLQSIVCLGDSDAGSVVDLASGTVDIDLDNGEAVACTFSSAPTSSNPATEEIDEGSRSAVRNYLYHRAGVILSSEPDRARIVRKSAGMLAPNGLYKLNAHGGADSADIEVAAKLTPDRATKLDLWVEGHYTRFKYDNGPNFEGDVGVVYFGADYLATNNLMLGVLSQIDWASESSEALGEDISGRGWMVGPYLSARLTENLFFDARGAWGQSSNQLSIAGYGVDDAFETNRRLLRGGLTGNKQFGNWRITPSVAVAYFEEEQASYVSSAGLLVGEQTVALGRATFEPEIAYRRMTGSGVAIELQFALAGLWDFKAPDDLSIADWTIGTDKARLRANSGLQISWPAGVALRASAFYDGIASSQFESYGARLWLSVPLRAARTAKREVSVPTSPPPTPPHMPRPAETADVMFAEAKANLTPEAYATLEALWFKVGGEDIRRIIIVAPGDSIDLAQRRGAALQNALIDFGVSPSSIDVVLRLEPLANSATVTISFR